MSNKVSKQGLGRHTKLPFLEEMSENTCHTSIYPITTVNTAPKPHKPNHFAQRTKHAMHAYTLTVIPRPLRQGHCHLPTKIPDRLGQTSYQVKRWRGQQFKTTKAHLKRNCLVGYSRQVAMTIGLKKQVDERSHGKCTLNSAMVVPLHLRCPTSPSNFTTNK